MSRAGSALMDDDPITLEEASSLVLRGAVTVSTLRAEVRRGNLTVEKIGKNLFTTPAYIRQMRERCRVQQSHHDSTSGRTKTGDQSGSSATGIVTDELAVLRTTAKALKGGLLNTSPKSTLRDQRQVANPIQFPSRKS
ncbi:hypothetical protein [Parvibaculum sp.]|uniref:hypothetical protein n=1 Tax=Parvibaculum sp. TaxID=2024848 RepID=UPI003C7927DF